jgi:hypothetical protein
MLPNKILKINIFFFIEIITIDEKKKQRPKYKRHNNNIQG